MEGCLYPFISQAFNNVNQFEYTPGMSVEHRISILDKLVRSYSANGYKYIAIVLCDVRKVFQTCPKYTFTKSVGKKLSGCALRLVTMFWEDVICVLMVRIIMSYLLVCPQVWESPATCTNCCEWNIGKKYTIENWMSELYRKSVISEFILWTDDTLKLIGCTSLESLNEAVNVAFQILRKFKFEIWIQFHFDKFDIFSKHNLEITFRNSTIESKREGLYLGYLLQQSKNSNFLVGTNQWERQYSRLSGCQYLLDYVRIPYWPIVNLLPWIHNLKGNIKF